MGVHRKKNNKKFIHIFFFSSCILENSSFFLSNTLMNNSSSKWHAPEKLFNFFVYLHSEQYGLTKHLCLKKYVH